MSGVLRIGALIVAALALAPALMPYTVERPDGDRVCVALKDGWHRARKVPSESDLREVLDALNAPLPTPDEMRDPQARAAYLAAERERQSTPGYERAAAYIEWSDGPGSCVTTAHRRLQMSLAVLAVAAMLALAARSTRDRGREPPDADAA